MDSIPPNDSASEGDGESGLPSQEVVPVPKPPDYSGLSPVSLSVSGSGGLTLWSDPALTETGETDSEVRLQLQPDKPVVIGRQRGGNIEYLDPRYTPTPMVPDSDQLVLKLDGDRDMYVSRGHFLLRATAEGIVLLNGVPHREGGVRPPLNGTKLLLPEQRRLAEGEEYLIVSGRSVTIRLPNGMDIVINAN